MCSSITRVRLRTEKELHKIEGDLRRSQRVCEQLDCQKVGINMVIKHILIMSYDLIYYCVLRWSSGLSLPSGHNILTPVQPGFDSQLGNMGGRARRYQGGMDNGLDGLLQLFVYRSHSLSINKVVVLLLSIYVIKLFSKLSVSLCQLQLILMKSGSELSNQPLCRNSIGVLCDYFSLNSLFTLGHCCPKRGLVLG